MRRPRTNWPDSSAVSPESERSSIRHFEGDKVAEKWVGADKLGLFIQLGVVDDPWPS